MLGRTAIALATMVALAGTAHADWPAGGKLVAVHGGINGHRNARILELPNGDLLALGVGVGGNNNTYVLQRLTHGGEFAPGWPSAGVRFSDVLKGTTLRWQSIVVDGASRVWHSWSGSNTQLEYVGPDPYRVPTFTPYNVGPSSIVAHAAPASGGEVFVTTNSGTRLKRITPEGATAAGWSSTGLALPNGAFIDHALMPDGSGGVVVFLRSNATTGVPAATRIDGNAVLHAGWPAAGLPLSGIAPVPPDLGPFDSQLLPSGPSHALAVWSLDAGSGMRRVMMQRFGFDATLDPAWPANGVEVVSADTVVACRAIADGSGGAYIVRQSHGRPVATHITAAGTLLASNVDLLDAGAQYVPTHIAGVPAPPMPDDIIADVTADGGLLVGWNDTRLAPAVSFRLRWLTPSLTLAPDKPDTGLVFLPGSPHPPAGCMLGLRADGTSGAFIAWSDYHMINEFQAEGDLWMAYVHVPTTVGVEPRTTPRLSLSRPRPNPANDSILLDFESPQGGTAEIALLDVTGRILRTQVVEGAGMQVVRFDALASLAPGLYFARAASRQGSSVVRVIVAR